jgi:hypothetical protein
MGNGTIQRLRVCECVCVCVCMGWGHASQTDLSKQ